VVADLFDSQVVLLAFRISVDEEEVAGEQVQGDSDSLFERSWRVAHSAQVGPLGPKCTP
jgi:hypothetical protein